MPGSTPPSKYSFDDKMVCKENILDPGIKDEAEAVSVSRDGIREVNAFIDRLEAEHLANPAKKSPFDLEFRDPRHFTFLLVAFASMGGLLSGLDQSLISGANLFLPSDLHLSSQQASMVNGAMSLGAVGGAIVLSPSNEVLGRRWSIILATVLYGIGACLEAGAIDYPMMIVGRLVLGVGLGLEGGTVPVYVAETVDRRLRGNMVSLYQFCIAVGEVLGYAIAAIFLKVEGNWRYILGSSLPFSTIMMIGMLYMPESPRFLMHKGRTLEAFRVWKRVRGTTSHESRAEFFAMNVSADQEEQAVAEGARSRQYPWLDFITVPRARRAIVYANVMILIGQLTGVNAIMYYMSVLMKQQGFDDITANYMSLVGGGSLLVGTIPACFLMETYGRRFWANAMLPGFFIGLVLVGVSYQLSDHAASLGVYLTGIILYMLFFGSYATLTWVIPAEVYPTYLRSYGMTTSDGLLFLSSFIVTYNFSAMDIAMTKTGLTLGFYGGIALLAYVYQLLFMPETKDKTLEEIDDLFQKPTKVLVRENCANVRETLTDLGRLRWRKVFHPVTKGRGEEMS